MPVFTEAIVNLAVNGCLIFHDASQYFFKIHRVTLRHVDTIHRHIQTVRDKFADDVFQRRFGNVHLVKRLNRKQPCCRASIAVVPRF